MSLKQEFIAQLDPLLLASETAIENGDAEEAVCLGREVAHLIALWVDSLSKEELREVLNDQVTRRMGIRL